MRATARWIGAVVAPTSALSALLYYFGWTRTMVEANRLGLDESLLGYSSQDYLLRSMSSMYGPLLVIFTVMLVAIGGHALVVAWARRLDLPFAAGADPEDRTGWRRMRTLAIGVAALGVLTLVFGYAGTRVHTTSNTLYMAGPLGVTTGALLLVYAASLYRRFLAKPRAEGAPTSLAGFDALAAGVVAMLVLVTLFWDIGRYAAVKGNQLADTVEAHVQFQPGVILYSAKRLYLQAPVVETKLDPENAAYTYAYTGLTLLFRSNGRYFFRPTDTRIRTNIVIPDGLDVRLELFHP